MPEELEQRLQEEARVKFPNDERRQKAYVYGTLRKTGWTPKKHEAGDWTPPWEADKPKRTKHMPKRSGYTPRLSDEELVRRMERGRTRPRARFKD